VNLSTGIITTVAGNGKPGFGGDGGPAIQAQLHFPNAIVLDGKNNLYIADGENQRIRKVDLATGKISTIAGKGQLGYSGDNGPAIAAKMYMPNALALDAKNNLYFTDCGNNRVRKVDLKTGIITTAAGSGAKGHAGDGGPAKAAKLNLSASPVLTGLAVDKVGNLYISGSASRIRKVEATTGIIRTIAGTDAQDFNGDGKQATATAFSGTGGIVLDEKGNILVVDQSHYRVRKVDIATGIVTTIAGNGTEGTGGDGGQAVAAQLTNPETLGWDNQGNLYITSVASIRKVDTKTGVITTVAGVTK
jgi:hypothetical protein